MRGRRPRINPRVAAAGLAAAVVFAAGWGLGRGNSIGAAHTSTPAPPRVVRHVSPPHPTAAHRPRHHPQRGR